MLHQVSELRTFQVLHSLWHHNYRYLVHTYSTFALIANLSLTTYGIVKFGGVSAIKLAVISLEFWLHLYVDQRMSGELHEMSTRFLQAWKSSILNETGNIWVSRQGKVALKQLKSILPFRLYVGGFYYVQRDSFLVSYDTVINNAVTLLLL